MKLQVSSETLITSFLAALVISVFAGLYAEDTLGQKNQKKTVAETVNMTAADFSSVSSNLISARQGVLNNDSTSAYDAINAAESELFILTQNTGDGNETLVKQLAKEFKPVLNNIDKARDALRDNNSTQALRSLNLGDVRILEIIQELPSGDAAEEDVEDD
jgi:hypothetical protein